MLHIVGGASGQGWLFAMAVALIYLSATGFPVLALVLGGFREVTSAEARITAGIGAAAGYVFTTGAVWATNGRAFAWWEFPLACALVLAVSTAMLAAWRAGGRSRASGAIAGRTA